MSNTTLATLLEERALATPDRPLIEMDRGDSRSYGQLNEEANRVAHGLAAIGIGRGDRVALMLPNCLEFIHISFALRKLGAVEVAIHTRTKGFALAHVLRTAQPRLLIIEDEFAGAVASVCGEIALPDVIVRGDQKPARSHLRGATIEPYEKLLSDRDDDPGIEVQDTELATVLFTSGTTGPSKGCMLSHRFGLNNGAVMVRSLGLGQDDCLYCPYPMSHVDSPYLTVGPAILTGGRAALGRKFSVSRFWEEARALGVTVFDFMGATLTMLWNQEERPDDADNPVRMAWGVPVPRFAAEFERRFDLQIVSGYGLTDGGMVSWWDPAASEPGGSAGRVADPWEVRIADEHDDPVQDGEVGEILIRASRADVTMKGYFGMPVETAETFRNMWLHTGDFGRFDRDGRLYFEGRKSESVRRRGENISTWEIEQVLESHPEVLEAVAVGVESELTEEDVHAFVVVAPGSELGGESLREFAKPLMADFMVPEVIHAVDEISKTDTGKPEKFLLKQRAEELRTGS